jgi:large subunit ribosomal protein L7/L12
VTTQNLEDIVQTLSNLKVTDLAKLKKMLEDTWGVTAAAPVAVAAPVAQAGGKAQEAAVESTEFQVTLESVPADKKIGVIKAVREITGLGLKEAKDIVEGAPKVLKETCPKAEAEDIAKKIEAAGAKATLKGL